MRDVTESKLLEQRLRHLATHDPLTGLLNRGAFDAELERSIAFARRFESAAALVLLDIDHFKYINDTSGHTVGDATLRRVADLLRARLRETDVLGRLGGDEFGVILAGTTAHASGAVADELLDAGRADTSIELEGNVVRLTASIGLAAIDPAGDTTAKDILREMWQPRGLCWPADGRTGFVILDELAVDDFGSGQRVTPGARRC